MNCSKPLLALVAALTCGTAFAQFSISFNFNDPLSTTHQDAFNAAAANWESVIDGYQGAITLSGIDITVFSSGVSTGPQKVFFQDGFWLSDEGNFLFDPATAPTDAMELENALTRDMALVLGVGSLWTLNSLYTNDSGEYTGANGLSAYQSEFAPSASFIPVEIYAGATVDVHWDEIDPTAGLINSSGQNFANELISGTPGPDSANTFLSDTTIHSLEDLGYRVSTGAAPVPEPSSLLLALTAGVLLLRRQRA